LTTWRKMPERTMVKIDRGLGFRKGGGKPPGFGGDRPDGWPGAIAVRRDVRRVRVMDLTIYPTY
jgi:hypothetical protein